MSWREIWSRTHLGSKLAAHICPEGERISLGITNTIARTGVANNVTLGSARALAFAILRACNEADPPEGRPYRADEAAIAGAQTASEAVAEMLRFAREGDYRPRAVFGDEVIGKLSEAAALALGIEAQPIFEQADQPEEYDNELTLRAVLSEALHAFVTCARPER